MAKQAIKTSLLDLPVIIGEETGTVSGPPKDAAGQRGKIVTVYYDRGGDLKYTILVANTGKLVELYSSNFKHDTPLT